MLQFSLSLSLAYDIANCMFCRDSEHLSIAADACVRADSFQGTYLLYMQLCTQLLVHSTPCMHIYIYVDGVVNL